MNLKFPCLPFIFALVLTAPLAHAASVIPSEGPFFPDANGKWKEYRVDDQEGLLANPGDDAGCFKSALPPNIRALFFEHFRYYVDHSKAKITEKDIAAFAKIAGIVPKESSGISMSVVDMKFGGSRETFRHFREDMQAQDKLLGFRSSVETMDDLMKLKNVTWNQQTNFGLTQMSADRLITFETKAYASTMIDNMQSLFRQDPDDLIRRCGAPHVFNEPIEVLRKRFGELQTCNYGHSKVDEVKCFGSWAILCPNFNLTLGILVWKNNPAYYATRKASPICAKTFRKVLQSGRADGKVVKREAKNFDPVKPRPGRAFHESLNDKTDGIPNARDPRSMANAPFNLGI